jgi:hypothetical protein
LSEEEMQQFMYLQEFIQANLPQQEEQPMYKLKYRKSAKKRKKSIKKKKKQPKKARVQQIDEEALRIMMQNQQNPAFQQQNIELPEGVDEIKEVDEEETPIRELREHEKAEELKDYEMESQQSESEAGVHDTDIPTQINAQVPAKFRPQEMEGEGEESEIEEDQYVMQPEEQENIPVIPEVSPEQLYYLQEMNKNQMIASKLENYADLFNPLSQSVAVAKKKYKKMNNYDLDIFDKKLHEDLICKRNGLKNFGVNKFSIFMINSLDFHLLICNRIYTVKRLPKK